MTSRPPPDITPRDFFESWLPAQLAEAEGTPRDLTVRVSLEGDGGGSWDLRSGPAGVESGPAGEGEPEVIVSQTVADWRAIVVGEPGAVTLAPPQAGPTDMMFVGRMAQQVVGAVKGLFRFEVTGYNGRTWVLAVQLGLRPAGAAPDATITVDAETYAAMLARTLPAPQAYFQGKIQITGDLNLAMQIAMGLLPRFA